jgi:type II secretory pathway pseudopilin PulG
VALIGLLVALTLVAMGAVVVAQRLVDKRQREAEADLLWVGQAYRQAIESYWRQSPGVVRALPTQLEDLLQDSRFPQPRRHLRKLYGDPLAPDQPWGVVRQGNAVIGVYSKAAGEPFRQDGFDEVNVGFAAARSYADWRFVAKLPAARPPAASPTPTRPIGVPTR